MHGYHFGRIGRITAGVLALGLIAPAASAQQWGQPQYRQQQQQQQPWEMEDFSPPGQRGFQQDYVTVGIDLDGDGRVDTTTTLTRWEYEQAWQKFEQERRMGTRFAPTRDPFRDQFQDEFYSSSQVRTTPRMMRQTTPWEVDHAAPTTRIRGTIQQTRNTFIQGINETHKLAQLRTREGQIITTDLGPVRKVEELNIRRGDEIEISGKPAFFEGQRILLANRVRTDQDTLTIRRPVEGTNLFRIEGRIRNIERLTIGESEPYTIASVTLEDGDRALVNLGPESELQDLNITRGDQISVLANSVPMMGQTLYHAHQIQAKGRTLSVRQLEEQQPRMQPAGFRIEFGSD